MGVAFTDVLIELSRPSARALFKRDPAAYLSGRRLTDDEVSALLKGELGSLFRYAQSTQSSGPSQQFGRHQQANDLLIEIDPVVELHTENNDNIAVGALGQVVVDAAGQYYRVVTDERGETA